MVGNSPLQEEKARLEAHVTAILSQNKALKHRLYVNSPIHQDPSTGHITVGKC